MARPGNDVPIERYNVRLPEPDSAWVKARQEEEHRSGPAIIAEAVRASRLRAAGADQDTEEVRVEASPKFQALQRAHEEAIRRLREQRRREAEQRKATPGELGQTPRCAWPVDALLDDAAWWDAWLPRLNELIGRDIGYAPSVRPPVDDRGYIDVMTLLFPPIEGVGWRSPLYPARAAAVAAHDRPEKVSRPSTLSDHDRERAHVWEPVIRHVARALAVLEASELPDADPYRAIQVQAEIIGPWATVLGQIAGPVSGELLDRLASGRR